MELFFSICEIMKKKTTVNQSHRAEEHINMTKRSFVVLSSKHLLIHVVHMTWLKVIGVCVHVFV